MIIFFLAKLGNQKTITTKLRNEKQDKIQYIYTFSKGWTLANLIFSSFKSSASCESKIRIHHETAASSEHILVTQRLWNLSNLDKELE